ncbi:MAG: 50S ribosomal protein L3 [Patescibacteria group bacterium]|nr:50S ribosomal protein L3 [Patescibacteria group bacterium]MDD4610520.1 50S ribosomal protein L3 [Patescibacteria group bacterium]
MKFIIGKKLDMTQVWQNEEVLAVTRVKVGSPIIVQIKTKIKDGYEAVQVGYGERKIKNIKKPQIGHSKKLGNFVKLKEFKTSAGDLKVGDKIDITTFVSGDVIQVTADSKGKGFQGVVKRHGFSGHKMTHGNKDQQRMSGSVGPKGPAHIVKGTRMGGRMGGGQVTVKNLVIVGVDEANNVLLIRGAVPGARNSLVCISGKGDLKINIENNKKQTEEVAENIVSQIEEKTSQNTEEVKAPQAIEENK